MFEILRKETFAAETYLMEVSAPHIAQSALPGQFLIVKMTEKAERIPLTISDYDAAEGTVTIVTQEVGASSSDIISFQVGESFADVVGPLGLASDFVKKPLEELADQHYIFIAGGVGTAPVYPQVKWLKEQGIDADVIIGSRTKVKIVKNKVAPPFRKCEFDIMFGEGISRLGEVFDLAVARNIINKSGAWFSYQDSKIGQGRDKTLDLLRDNPELVEEIEAKVREAIAAENA